MRSLALIDIFKGVMMVLIALFLVLLFHDPIGTQLNVFFLRTDDLFADFFNPLIYIADNDVYHNTLNGLHHKIYFPLTYMLFSLFSGFNNYSGSTLNDTYVSHPAMLSCVLFTLISILIFLHALNKVVRTDALTIFIILFSSVFLFTIERGNPIMFAAALVCYFIAYNNSPLWYERYFAMISLCVAVVLKGFPVLLGLYLLQERRFKEIIFCILITILLVFLPFLYFKGGFDNISQLVSNIQLHNQLFEDAIYPRFGLSVFNLIAINIFHLYDASYTDIGFKITKGLVILMSMSSLILFFIQRSSWKKLMLLVSVIAFLPSDNGFYCGIYFFPVLLLFLKEEKLCKRNYIYVVLFCMLFNPIQITKDDIPISWMISNFAVFIIWAMLICETHKNITNTVLTSGGALMGKNTNGLSSTPLENIVPCKKL